MQELSLIHISVGQPNTYYGLSTLLGEGNGAFSSPMNTLESLASQTVLPGNFYNDSAADFIVQTGYGPALYLGQGGTSLSLGNSGSSVSFGSEETFTATLAASMPGRPTPTGAVSFYDGATLLGLSLIHISEYSRRPRQSAWRALRSAP